MKDKSMRSITYNNKIFAYSTDNAGEFNRERIKLINLGYKITKIVLTDDGKFKLLARLKNKLLVKCLLKDKQISSKDKVYPHHTNSPKSCHYYRDGVCLCINHCCLYQDTKANIKELKFMVDKYDKNKNKDYYNDERSDMYEDTELGRIFSAEFRHLNYREEEE